MQYFAIPNTSLSYSITTLPECNSSKLLYKPHSTLEKIPNTIKAYKWALVHLCNLQLWPTGCNLLTQNLTKYVFREYWRFRVTHKLLITILTTPSALPPFFPPLHFLSVVGQNFFPHKGLKFSQSCPSNGTKFIKAFYYSWNLLFKMKPQLFQCLKNCSSYANLKREYLSRRHVML